MYPHFTQTPVLPAMYDEVDGGEKLSTLPPLAQEKYRNVRPYLTLETSVVFSKHESKARMSKPFMKMIEMGSTNPDIIRYITCMQITWTCSPYMANHFILHQDELAGMSWEGFYELVLEFDKMECPPRGPYHGGGR
eukprot:PhF_6_TR6085/c1_g2_i13/m.8883